MDRRVRTGCLTCLKRRVKCDEAKPFCARCRTGNFVCEGYRPPRRVSPPLSASVSELELNEAPSQEIPWRHVNWRQEQLPLYHHFVTTTVLRIFRNDHVAFWRDEVAQMSYGKDIVYEALLALGAIHRSSLLSCQYGNSDEAARSKLLALRAYGNTLRMLRSDLVQHISEAFSVLIVLILLTYFECFQDNPKGAFQHLWAAIQLLRGLEIDQPDHDISKLVPLLDSMLRLDFLAQKLVPYASSSFSIYSSLALGERPFWNRPSPQFLTSSQPDQIAAERYLLIQLICGHNKLSRVIWGCWCPTNERPNRDELLGFYSEMQLWKANSPATFARCDGLDIIEAFDSMDLSQRPIPPPACQLLSNEMALSIVMYNAYMGCALAMITTTDEDPTSRELEAFNLVYQSLCLAAGLIDRQTSSSPYKPCDALSAGISIYLYHGVRRSFSLVWQQWTIGALRAVGREGLSNGFTNANAVEVMCQLEAKMQRSHQVLPGQSPLGHIRDRLIPLLLPRSDDDRGLAFYLRYGNLEIDGDEKAIQAVAKATWKQDSNGVMGSVTLEVYEESIEGYPHPPIRPNATQMFISWRQEVEKGWHGYLAMDVEEGCLQRKIST